jgi:hypothetical protein
MCPAVFAFAGEGLEGLWLCFGFVTSVVVVFLAVRGAVKRSVRTLQTAFGIAVVVQTLEMFFLLPQPPTDHPVDSSADVIGWYTLPFTSAGLIAAVAALV